MSHLRLPHLRHLPLSARCWHLLDHLQPRRRAALRRPPLRHPRPESHPRHRLRHPLRRGTEREEQDWEVSGEEEEKMSWRLIYTLNAKGIENVVFLQSYYDSLINHTFHD